MDMFPIIILNWNNSGDTIECINSILKNSEANYQIFLIDNGSDKEDVDLLVKKFSKHSKIEIILNKSNLGFTKAHNSVLKQLLNSEVKHVFLLNNDTELPQNSFKILKKSSIKDNEGAISCKMVSYWNHEILDNAGHKMYTSGEIVPLGHARPINKYNEPLENIGACAGAALYSTAMLKDIGLFDEYFDTGYEDAELGLRAFIAGYKCTYEPRAIIYHKMGQSIKKIFNYNYVVKIQTNIYYSYIKLVHWQIIVTGFIPWIVRLSLITLVDLIFWRPRYLKVQYMALYYLFFRDWKKVMKARKESKHLRRISWLKLLKKQEFFLFNDIQNFYKFIIKGEKSYFEKY